jgi:hypothetical protein
MAGALAALWKARAADAREAAGHGVRVARDAGSAFGGSAFDGSAFGGSAFDGSAFDGSGFGGSAFDGSGFGGGRSALMPARPMARCGADPDHASARRWPPSATPPWRPRRRR